MNAIIEQLATLARENDELRGLLADAYSEGWVVGRGADSADGYVNPFWFKEIHPERAAAFLAYSQRLGFDA